MYFLREKILFFLIYLFGFTQIFCDAELADMVAAKVNDTVFVYSEIVQESAFLNIENGVPANVPMTSALESTLLDLLIVRDILFMEARDKGVFVSDSELDKKFAVYMSKPQISGFLKDFEISELEFKVIIKKRMIADKMALDFLDKKFKERKVTDEEKKKSLLDWFDFLKKKQRITLFLRAGV